MGAGASVEDEKHLYTLLVRELEASTSSALVVEEEKVAEDVEEEEEEGEISTGEAYNTSSRQKDETSRYKEVYDFWFDAVLKKKDVWFVPLLDLEKAVDRAFESGKTPLLLDSSLDDKTSTFYSYQTQVGILEATEMVFDSVRKNKLAALDVGRRCLVNAMQNGKTLLVRCGTSAPDFMNILNDCALDSHDNTRKCSAYFPIELFERGGERLRDPQLNLELDLSAQEARRKMPPSWAERLFRDTDMLPHKNFAICKQSFRVMVTSQLPLHDALLAFFGSHKANFPSRDLFQIVVICDDEQNEPEWRQGLVVDSNQMFASWLSAGKPELWCPPIPLA